MAITDCKTEEPDEFVRKKKLEEIVRRKFYFIVCIILGLG